MAGVWSPQPPKAIGGLPQPEARGCGALGVFCNISIKVTHLYEYFGQNSYFIKAIEKQSKRIT